MVRKKVCLASMRHEAVATQYQLTLQKRCSSAKTVFSVVRHAWRPSLSIVVSVANHPSPYTTVSAAFAVELHAVEGMAKGAITQHLGARRVVPRHITMVVVFIAVARAARRMVVAALPISSTGRPACVGITAAISMGRSVGLTRPSAET